MTGEDADNLFSVGVDPVASHTHTPSEVKCCTLRREQINFTQSVGTSGAKKSEFRLNFHGRPERSLLCNRAEFLAAKGVWRAATSWFIARLQKSYLLMQLSEFQCKPAHHSTVPFVCQRSICKMQKDSTSSKHILQFLVNHTEPCPEFV